MTEIAFAVAPLTAQSVQRGPEIALKNGAEVVSLCCVLGSSLFPSRVMRVILAGTINLLQDANERSLVSLSCLMIKKMSKGPRRYTREPQRFTFHESRHLAFGLNGVFQYEESAGAARESLGRQP